MPDVSNLRLDSRLDSSALECLDTMYHHGRRVQPGASLQRCMLGVGMKNQECVPPLLRVCHILLLVHR